MWDPLFICRVLPTVVLFPSTSFKRVSDYRWTDPDDGDCRRGGRDVVSVVRERMWDSCPRGTGSYSDDDDGFMLLGPRTPNGVGRVVSYTNIYGSPPFSCSRVPERGGNESVVLSVDPRTPNGKG